MAVNSAAATEATPSAETLIARAREIAPRIAERAAAAEQARRIHDETIEEVAAAELFQILVAKRHGGHELQVQDMVDVLKVLSPLCVSTGWTMGFYMIHNWMWCLLPLEAQEEIFADTPYCLGPVMVAPTVRARAVEGGYRIKGQAKWATGSSHAQWCMVSGVLEDTDDTPPPRDGKPAPPRVRMFAMPWSDAECVDTWRTSGMAATASHDAVFDDVFIPAHRVMDVGPARSGESPSASLFGSPLYSAAFTPMLAIAALAPMVGGAVGVAAHTVDRAKTFLSTYSGRTAVDNPALQIRLGRADLTARSAETLLDALVADICRDALSPPVDIASRADQRARASHIAHLCRETAALLAFGSGASGHMLTSPIQRAFRDLSMAACHVVFDHDPTMELHGKMLVGKPPEVILA